MRFEDLSREQRTACRRLFAHILTKSFYLDPCIREKVDEFIYQVWEEMENHLKTNPK